ncbi:MAG TPA: hypothetical protein VGO50_12210 [Pyrinomonadaceae bacterium]|nr:hypothetical protein [Pyrinomonadaceae bacterium]
MRLKLFLLLIFTIFLLSGCGSAPEAVSPANTTANRAALPVNSAENPAINSGANSANSLPVNAASIANQTANQMVSQALANQPMEAEPLRIASPTEAFKSLGDAGNRKDLRALVQLFNQKSLELFAEDARAQGKLIDVIMLNQRAVTVAKAAPAVRNEKINGDSATLEVKMAGGNWEKMYFTKENGQWKVAMDKYMEEMIRQVEEPTRKLEKRSDREGDR